VKIKKVVARKILNSMNNPTIEVVVNKKYSCSSPIGVTTGNFSEPLYSEDIGHSIEFINNLKQLKGTRVDDFEDLYYLESIKEDLGANGLYALQGAILKTLSNNNVWSYLNSNADKMPIPIGNCVGGGSHGKNDVDFQEFLIFPKIKYFSDGIFANEYIYKRLGKEFNIREKNYVGAWAPNLNTNSILDILTRTAESASNDLGFNINVGLDLNANNLFKNELYKYKNFSSTRKERKLKRDEHIEFINSLIEDYDLKYIEDPVEENDEEGYKRIKSKLVCADNLTCTNLERLKKIKDKINVVSIKPNQIGSLNLVKDFIDYAKENNIIPIMSHRAGETKDDLIAHLAVAWEIPFIKCGISGKERLAKINTLKKIEQEING
jgi:enolase|tara:strand:+ start:9300 stop:10436 length:1137 start_codon:yes stop_codon:yes gene_type:complete